VREFTDRFGPLPPEVENLLYVLKMKVLAAKAFVGSVTAEGGEIVLRPVEGLRFDRQKLQHLTRSGVRVDRLQVGINRRRRDIEWRKVLEEVLRGMA